MTQKHHKKKGFNNVFAGFYVISYSPISSDKFLKSFIFPKDLCLDPGVFCFLDLELLKLRSNLYRITTWTFSPSNDLQSWWFIYAELTRKKTVGKQKCRKNWGKTNSKWVFLFNMPPTISRFLLLPRDLTIWSQSLVEVEVKQSFLCIACSFRKMSDLVPYIAIYQLDLQLKKGALWVLIIS